MATPRFVVLLLAAVLVTAACTAADPAPPTTTTTTTTLGVAIRTAAPSPVQVADGVDGAIAEQLGAEIAELRATAESLRGLGFLNPPRLALETPAGFAARWAALLDEQLDGPRLAADTALWRLLGLLGPGDDVRALTIRALPAPQVVFYDGARAELVVSAGAALDAAGRTEVVGQLVRALTDQYHGHTARIAELRAAGDEDGADALAALALADALHVELRYVGGLDREQQRQVATRGVAVVDGPRFLVEELTFAGNAGLAFVDALLEVGGTAQLDAAYEASLTTESILHPHRFVAGEGVLDLVVADVELSGFTVGHAGSRGELGLRSLLAAAVTPGILTQTADGWGSDHEILLQNGDAVVYGYVFRGDGVEDAFEVAQAFIDHATFVMGMAEPIDAGGGIEFVGLAATDTESAEGEETTTTTTTTTTPTSDATDTVTPAAEGPYVFVDRVGDELVVVVATDPVDGRRLRDQLGG